MSMHESFNYKYDLFIYLFYVHQSNLRRYKLDNS